MTYPQKKWITSAQIVEKFVETNKVDQELLYFLELYPKKSQDIPNIKPAWEKLMALGVFPSDLQAAARSYADENKQSRGGRKKLRLPQNFLSEGFWLKYVPAALHECPLCGGRRFIEDFDAASNPIIVECSCTRRYDKLWMEVQD